jgi:hypothetical protein
MARRAAKEKAIEADMLADLEWQEWVLEQFPDGVPPEIARTLIHEDEVSNGT